MEQASFLTKSDLRKAREFSRSLKERQVYPCIIQLRAVIIQLGAEQ